MAFKLVISSYDLKLSLKCLLRGIARLDKRVARDYFTNKALKLSLLHFGCGYSILSGWLNVDVYPLSRKVMRCDGRKKLPFREDQFDCIYCEHMIEHIEYGEALSLAQEFKRILKPGGTIRIVTPDLERFAKMVLQKTSRLEEQYIKWVVDTAGYPLPTSAGSVINVQARSHGHKYLYTSDTLCMLLEYAGFSKIVKCKIGESNHPAMCELENTKRMNNGFLDLESMILEATKGVTD